MEKIKCVIYTRVSSTNGRQNNERQIEQLKDYASKMGYKVCKIYAEQGSGKRMNGERQTLTDALDFCVNNSIDYCLFSEISRLGRDKWEIPKTAQFLETHQINAYFYKESLTLLDTNKKVTPALAFILYAFSIMAEIERETILFRLNSGRALARERKTATFGRPKGSNEDIHDKLHKYPVTIKYLKRGWSHKEVLYQAVGEGEKISLGTIKRLSVLLKSSARAQ